MKVTVEIDQKWVRITRSPLYGLVAGLSGGVGHFRSIIFVLQR